MSAVVYQLPAARLPMPHDVVPAYLERAGATAITPREAASPPCERILSLRDPESLPAGVVVRALPAAQFFDGLSTGPVRDTSGALAAFA